LTIEAWPFNIETSQLPDAPPLITSYYPFHGSYKFCPDPARDISVIIKDEMPDIQQFFMDNVNVEGLLLSMKPIAQDGVFPLPCRPLPQSIPFFCPWLLASHTSAWMINTTRSSGK